MFAGEEWHLLSEFKEIVSIVLHFSMKHVFCKIATIQNWCQSLQCTVMYNLDYIVFIEHTEVRLSIGQIDNQDMCWH